MSWMHGPYYGGAKTLSQAENTLMQYAKQDGEIIHILCQGTLNPMVGVFIVFTNEDPLQSDQVNSGYTLLYTVDGSTVSVSIKYNQVDFCIVLINACFSNYVSFRMLS